MDSDIYLVCEDPIKKKDVVFEAKSVEDFTSTSTHIRFNDWRAGAIKKEEQPTEEKKQEYDIDKGMSKLLDVLLIGSLLKSLNPDDKED